MSFDHQTQSVHHFFSFAALDRINFLDLPNDKPIGNVTDLDFTTFLPNLEDCNAMRNSYATLLGRELVAYFGKHFSNCVPSHIPHQYSTQMKEKSVVVSKCMYCTCNYYNLYTCRSL